MQNESTLKTILLGSLSLLIIVLIVNILFFVMPTLRNLGNSFVPAGTMTVSAEGKTTASPDLAVASFSVIARGKNPNDLTQNNNDKIAAAIMFLKSLSIDQKDIKSTAYNLSPDYAYDQNTSRNYITGYTLTQTVEVRIHDLTKVASVIGGLTPLGINQIGGANFTIEDEDKVLSAAREDAFTKAHNKAVEMARQTGAHLGRVLSVSEGGTPVPIPYFGRAESMGPMGVPSAPTIEPGTQELTVTETVTYALE